MSITEYAKHQLITEAEAVLMVVDVQERLCVAMEQPWLERVVMQIGLMTLLAKLERIPVLLTEQYPQGLGPTRPDVLAHLDGMAYQSFSKTSFGCGGDPGITQALNASKKRKIILTGMETHICVYLTALGLIEKGYDVFVCHDAVISRTRSNHDNGLKLIERAGGVVTNTETLAFQMMGCSGDATFKAISQYLKSQAETKTVGFLSPAKK